MNKCPHCGSEVSASDNQCAKCGEVLRTQGDGLIGKSLAGKYQIEELLGAGGMCEVYRAINSAMGKQVAVKVLKPALAADRTIAQRFEQEARAASLIHHPHAINVMDYGIAEGNTPFIVMEFVQGITVGELLRKEGALPVERAANILRQICGALDVAHSVGVVHRDIKPDNIMIAEYDEGSDWVEVLDFGVAKVQEDVNRRGNLTGANIIVGTPRYMSPEQCEEKPVDARSDIYSLAVVLYEMLSGEAPFKGDSSTRLLVAHAHEPPEPLRNTRPNLSPELEAVVMRALEKDPARRPQSAGEFASEFAEAAGLGQPAHSEANRAGAFSRISVPLGEEKRKEVPVSEQASGPDTQGDEATLVRPRSARTPVPQSNTPAQSNTPVQQRLDDPSGAQVLSAGSEYASQPPYSTPPHGATYVTSSQGYQKHNNTAGIAALVIVLLAVAGIAAYLVFGSKGFGRNSTSEAVVDAQQSVTEAIARVDSLPKDHALRSYLLDLRQWQGELKAYQEVREDNPQITDKAERYRQKAEDISGQVRAAQAALGREPTAAPNANAPHAASASTPTQEAAKPAEGGAKSDAEIDKESAPADKEANESGEQSKNANGNKSKPRKAEPPVIDPVRPQSESESAPKNSNRPNKNSPPVVEKVKPQEKPLHL
jgi:serine/threonine protein kinase